MFCYSVRIGYELFFEDRCRPCGPQLILERNHVVFLAFLFSCQRTDLAERADRLPDPLVRVKRNVFSNLNPLRLTRTPVPRCAAGIGKIELPEELPGSRILCRRPPFVNHRVGNSYNLAPCLAIPASRPFRLSAAAAKNRGFSPPGLSLTACCETIFQRFVVPQRTAPSASGTGLTRYAGRLFQRCYRRRFKERVSASGPRITAYPAPVFQPFSESSEVNRARSSFRSGERGISFTTKTLRARS